jgi:hypothetical protein
MKGSRKDRNELSVFLVTEQLYIFQDEPYSMGSSGFDTWPESRVSLTEISQFLQETLG